MEVIGLLELSDLDSILEREVELTKQFYSRQVFPVLGPTLWESRCGLVWMEPRMNEEKKQGMRLEKQAEVAVIEIRMFWRQNVFRSEF